MALFSIIVCALAFAVIVGWRKWEELQGLATSVLPVVVSVVGTTTGFYFGIKAAAEDAAKGSSTHDRDLIAEDER